MTIIQFYRVNQPYGEFSNFSPHPIELGGRSWPTSEHYFQGQKFAGTVYEDVVRTAGPEARVAATRRLGGGEGLHHA